MDDFFRFGKPHFCGLVHDFLWCLRLFSLVQYATFLFQYVTFLQFGVCFFQQAAFLWVRYMTLFALVGNFLQFGGKLFIFLWAKCLPDFLQSGYATFSGSVGHFIRYSFFFGLVGHLRYEVNHYVYRHTITSIGNILPRHAKSMTSVYVSEGEGDGGSLCEGEKESAT